LKISALSTITLNASAVTSRFAESGADPARRLRGAISVRFGCQSHNDFRIVRGMKYISQHCCGKTMNDKMPYIANAVFRIVKNHGE